MRVLILGGTAFVGVHLTDALLQRGHHVTHFNRGRTGTAPPGVRTVRGDRSLGFDGLEDQRFDAVIDTSGYVPHEVERATRFFESRCARYVFISTISIYDFEQAEIFEDSPMPALPEGAPRTEVTNETYGPLKALCERIVASTFRQRATILRPSLVAGPHDMTDRFTYWPVRFSRGGEILAPGTPDRPIQFIDARDLAKFATHLIERESGGEYTVISPQRSFTMGQLVEACAEIARVPSTVRWLDDEFLIANQVAPWMDLPLWVPPSDNKPGLTNHNATKALTAGLTIRPLKETVRDTLSWAQTRPRDYVPVTGIIAEREAELLEASAGE